MRKLTIVLPQEVVNEVQRAALEMNARQGVIDRYLEKHMEDEDSKAIDSKPFKHFMTLLAEAESEFELAKETISKEYIPSFLAEHSLEWELDYSSNIMTITILCDCEIDELKEEE